ncbi:MAG: 2-oxo acid dehydrogenase subunit E2, partial [Clostridia bacterium]|nr:2-oxo acid dehydrogenase subunit E2 [Clostridia bacterium]
KKAVVTENDEIEVRRVLPICIAFDHRALDFGDIVPFMKKLDEIFASPEVIFSWRKQGRRLRRISA